MLKKCLFGLGTVALAVASAASSTINLYQDSMLNGTRLPAGEYRMEVQGDRVVLQKGKLRAEAPVTHEAGSKNRQTSVKFDSAGGQMNLKEISVGGASERLVINDTNAKTDLMKPAGAN